MKPDHTVTAFEHIAPPNKVGRTVYLHVAIPTEKENLRLTISLVRRLRRIARQSVDWAAWWWNQTFLFKGYNYTDTAYSNRGDIAIKLAIKELLRKSLTGHTVTFVETEWGCLDAVTLERINSQAALFVIAGGGYWVFDRSQKMSPSFLLDAPYFGQMHCPIVVFGSGVNFNLPTVDAVLDGDIDRELKDALLRFDQQVQLFAVRCKSSRDFFYGLGLRKPQLLCDPAVFKEIGVVPVRAKSHRLAIGVNFALHGKFVEHQFKKNVATYIQFLKIIQQKFQPNLTYFIHSDEEVLVVRLLRSAGIVLQVVDVPANQLTAEYSQMDVVVCQMMHANILSFNAGVPALNIAYDSKNSGFNQLIGMQAYCISAYTVTLNQLVAKMADLIQDRSVLASRLASRKKELEIRMDEVLGQIRQIALPEPDEPAQVAELARVAQPRNAQQVG